MCRCFSLRWCLKPRIVPFTQRILLVLFRDFLFQLQHKVLRIESWKKVKRRWTPCLYLVVLYVLLNQMSVMLGRGKKNVKAKKIQTWNIILRERWAQPKQRQMEKAVYLASIISTCSLPVSFVITKHILLF